MAVANAVTSVRWARLPSPFVKVDRLGSSDLMVIGLHRVWDDLTFLVRAVHHWEGSGAPDWTTVNDLAHRVDALLHDHEGQTADLEIHSFREESFTDALVENGRALVAQRRIYRVRAARSLPPSGCTRSATASACRGSRRSGCAGSSAPPHAAPAFSRWSAQMYELWASISSVNSSR